jgi:glycosyltransferase involved in cell wall biosynthesis
MNINFSIVMPNYNSNFLKRAIKSVINQTYDKWELIIVDNYSNNNPEKIVDIFKDKRIFFSKFRNNSNIAKSRNYGIKQSKFDWIAFLDSDDVWEKNKLFLVKKNIEKLNPDLIYHGMYYLPKRMMFFKKIIQDKSKKMEEPIYDNLIKFGNGIANSSVVVKKKKLLEIDLISESKNKYSWEDYDCWIRLAKNKNNFSFINKVLGFCWVGEGRVSNSYQNYKNCKNFIKIYKKELKSNLDNKLKRPDWILRLYSNFFFDNKSFFRSYYFLIKSNDKKIKTLLKILFLFSKSIFLKKIFQRIKYKFRLLNKMINNVIIYNFDQTNFSYKKEPMDNENFQFYIFKEYRELRDFKNFFYCFDNKEFLKRFKKKHEILALIDKKNKNIACYGWKSIQTPHLIEELNKKIYFDEGNILYDFKTLSDYKNRKLYKLLLNKIILNVKKPLYIYSLTSNKFSNNAILKVGFNSLTKLNILSNDFNQTNIK